MPRKKPAPPPPDTHDEPQELPPQHAPALEDPPELEDYDAEDPVPFANPFDRVPTSGTAYLYTTDRACTYGKARAFVTRLTCPVDEQEILRRFGGGPYELLVKDDATGRLVACVPFALAGPSMLRQMAGARADEPEGFWERVAARHAGAGVADPLEQRLARLEELLTARAPQPTASERMLERLAEATIQNVTTRQSAGPLGQSFKEFAEATALLESIKGRDEEPGIGQILGALLPALLAGAQQQPARAPQPMPAPSSPAALPAAAPGAEPPAPAPAPATRVLPDEGLARLTVALAELDAAIAKSADRDETAALICDILGPAIVKALAGEREPATTVLRTIATVAPGIADRLSKEPGRAYLETTIEEARDRAAEPDASSPAA